MKYSTNLASWEVRIVDEENKNQIKIKINGEDKEFKEELIIHDWKAKREVAATEERAIPLLKNKKKKDLHSQKEETIRLSLFLASPPL